jgi:hypothetical protein
MNKRTLLKLAFVMSLLVVNVIAATPGSSCTVRARIAGVLSVTLPGRVSSNGRNCGPLSITNPLLTALRSGVTCNDPEYLIGAIIVSASCPR